MEAMAITGIRVTGITRAITTIIMITIMADRPRRVIGAGADRVMIIIPTIITISKITITTGLNPALFPPRVTGAITGGLQTGIITGMTTAGRAEMTAKTAITKIGAIGRDVTIILRRRPRRCPVISRHGLTRLHNTSMGQTVRG